MTRYLDDQSNILGLLLFANDPSINDDRGLDSLRVFDLVDSSRRSSSFDVHTTRGRVDCGHLEGLWEKGACSPF